MSMPEGDRSYFSDERMKRLIRAVIDEMGLDRPNSTELTKYLEKDDVKMVVKSYRKDTADATEESFENLVALEKRLRDEQQARINEGRQPRKG